MSIISHTTSRILSEIIKSVTFSGDSLPPADLFVDNLLIKDFIDAGASFNLLFKDRADLGVEGFVLINDAGL